jgi:hypothetical protein
MSIESFLEQEMLAIGSTSDDKIAAIKRGMRFLARELERMDRLQWEEKNKPTPPSVVRKKKGRQ